jgi:hypothetical protein
MRSNIVQVKEEIIEYNPDQDKIISYVCIIE